ncbi:MAG: S1 RNA-binding domain-containing protein [Chloroflexaceae bacterium]|nr:S1 RNA-binding domain-containing protein [Chloroflexaceae bacterium]
MELEGRVTSIAMYGVFVDIGVGRDGLVHISEMSDSRIESPSDVVQIGDTVKVRVKSVDVEARRISLTMRPPRVRSENRPHQARAKRVEIDREALSNIKVGDTIDGTIIGLAPFGAFVDIGVGKDGLVHISELSEHRVEKPEDAVQVHQQYPFKVLEIDPDGNRISLSLRRAQRVQKMQQLSPGQIIEGKVSGMAPFGAFVDIGVGRDGLVHISQLSENHVGKVEDVVKEGDTVSVRVLEVDPQSKRISLTMRLEEPEEKKEVPDAPVPRTGPAAAPRFADIAVPREEGRRRGGGNKQEGRSAPVTQAVSEVYVSEDDSDEEEFEGNATLEDLLNKFSKNPGRRDRRRTDRKKKEEGEEGEEGEGSEEDFPPARKQQRLAQRRTLKMDVDE